MAAKHVFKVIIAFSGMILLGLVIHYVLNYLNSQVNTDDNVTTIETNQNNSNEIFLN